MGRGVARQSPFLPLACLCLHNLFSEVIVPYMKRQELILTAGSVFDTGRCHLEKSEPREAAVGQRQPESAAVGSEGGDGLWLLLLFLVCVLLTSSIACELQAPSTMTTYL